MRFNNGQSGRPARSYLPGTIAVLCTLAAFILSLLCLFAGSKPGFLENANLLTVNTSMLGQTFLNTTKGNGIFASIEQDIKGEVNDVVGDVAKALNIHDFYSAHLLDYCEGYYTPSPVANKTETPSKNITKCSNHTSLFHFDPTAIIQSELRPGVDLSSLKWPDAIRNGVRGVELASKVMFVLYCIAIAATGIALIFGIIGLLRRGKVTDICSWIMAFLAFIALLIASSLVTKVITRVSNSINKYGNDIGIFAYKGRTFLGMTWAATGLMFITLIVWLWALVQACRRPRSKSVI